MTAKLKDISAKLRKRMHDPIEQTGGWLKQVVQGYFNYHAVPGNMPRLKTFRHAIGRYWRFTLRRRSQSRSRWTWDRMYDLLDRYIPQPRVLHPYPLNRFRAKYPR